MKIIVRNARGVNLRTAPVDGEIIKLVLAGTELEVDGVISVNHETWVQIKEPYVHAGVLTDAYAVVKSNGVQYCYFVAESVDEYSEYSRGWNDCLDAIKISIPGRK